MLRNSVFIILLVFSVFVPCASWAKPPSGAAKQEQRKLPVIYVPRPDYVYDIGGKRDPFIPLITADGRFVQLERTPEEIAESELKLEGIIYDKYGLSYAIVNGAVLKVGDLILDYQVLGIEESKVVFIREGQTKEVLLKKED